MNNELISKLEKLSKEYGLKKLILFGSAVDSFDDARDIDFACEGLTGRKFLRFGAKLDEIFNKTVDLIQMENNDRFVREIMRKGVVIYES